MSGGEAILVKANTLSKNAKIWHYFIGSQLIPSSHLSDVKKYQATLIFYILTRHSVDIGGFMHAFITFPISTRLLYLEGWL